MSILPFDDFGSISCWLGDLLEHEMAQLWNRVGLHLLQHHPDNGALLRLPSQEVGCCRSEETLGPCRHVGDVSRKMCRNVIARGGWPDLLSVDELWRHFQRKYRGSVSPKVSFLTPSSMKHIIDQRQRLSVILHAISSLDLESFVKLSKSLSSVSQTSSPKTVFPRQFLVWNLRSLGGMMPTSERCCLAPCLQVSRLLTFEAFCGLDISHLASKVHKVGPQISVTSSVAELRMIPVILTRLHCYLHSSISTNKEYSESLSVTCRWRLTASRTATVIQTKLAHGTHCRKNRVATSYIIRTLT